MTLDRLVSLGILLDPRPPARRRLEAFQDARLRRLVRHAGSTVPWYRAKLDRLGIRPETIRGRADLEMLPCITKDELRAAGETALSRQFAGSRLVRRRTSGSSGLPLTVTFTPGEERILMSLRLRVLFRLGLRPHHRIATIWPPQRTGRLPWVLRWAQGAGLFRFHEIDVTADHREIARRLLEIRPHIVIGYPNILCLVAAELTTAGRTWSPHRVLAGGETLTAGARRYLATVFGCEVTEVYGSHEFNLIAWQCRDTGMLHVCGEGVLVEVLREDGSPAAEGEAGELVGTALHSFAQPLLRYRLGDIVTRGPDPCPCGLPYATLAEIRGRRVDRLMLPDGGSVSGLHLLDEVGRTQSWVRQYRLVQEDRRRVVLQLVPMRHPGAEELASLEALVSAQLAPTFEWRVELVHSLPAGRDGKSRLVESRVQRTFD